MCGWRAGNVLEQICFPPKNVLECSWIWDSTFCMNPGYSQKTPKAGYFSYISQILTLSDFCTDISVRKWWPAMTFVRIYPYTDFTIEIWGFYRRLNDTLRYHDTRCSRDFGLLLAAILKHVYQRKKSGVYSELSAVFGEFWKITIVGPSSIHPLAWNTTANYMDFLPWKWSSWIVWFEDHSFSVEFVRWSDGKPDLTHVRVFILNNSFSEFQYFY